MDLLRSKKFQTSLVGVLVALLAHLGFDLDGTALLTVISPIIASIAGQGVADIGKEKAKVEKG